MAAQGLPVQLACRALAVSESGYYAKRSRAPSARSICQAWLTEKIRQVHTASRGTYGIRRIHRAAVLLVDKKQLAHRRLVHIVGVGTVLNETLWSWLGPQLLLISARSLAGGTPARLRASCARCAWSAYPASIESEAGLVSG